MLLTVHEASRDGIELAADAVAASVAGDSFPNLNGQACPVFVNASGAPITVTFAVPTKLDGNDVVPRAVVVPAASTSMFGPWPKGVYNDGDDLVQMTYSSVVDLYVKVVKASPA